MPRVWIGGLAGGIIMFLWSALAHMALPIGTMGLKTLPDEGAVLGVMQSSIPEPGLYFFPGMDLTKPLSEEEGRAWEEKYRSGPVGLLVYRPKGGEPLTTSQFSIEVLSNVLAALVAAFVLFHAGGSYARRVLLTGLFGLFAWLSISVSHWNWDGFPSEFILGEGIEQVVGWLLAGLAVAWIVRPMR